jgi:hypothetical protein
MGAPAVTVRTTPTGNMLKDGFSTLIALSIDPDISFWEKSVQPPGIDGGDPVKTSTMHNTDWHTMRPRKLKDMSPASTTVAWDPLTYGNIVDAVNKDTSVTLHFPSGDSLSFFGFLQKFEPGDMKEGEQPEAKITIVCTNWDYENNVESAPLITVSAGS